MRRIKLTALFVARATGLFRLTRLLTRDRLRILCYHGFAFADECAFRPKLFIDPTRFERRLQAIRRAGLSVIPLDEAIDRLYAGQLPPDCVTITVDDGFHAFYALAVPHLRRHRFTATVYVTTYYVQNANPVYRLAVQYMFWKTARRELVLRNVVWADDRVVDLSDPAQHERALWECINYGEHQCTEAQRQGICEQLGEVLGLAYAEIVRAKILHLMTPDELASLAAADIAVELHTHRHNFPDTNRKDAEQEIADNRATLSRWLVGDRHHFCYPSGMWHECQWPWLDEMQVKSSTIGEPGLNTKQTPRHALRRFLDGDNIHQLEFEAELSGFAELARNARALFKS